MLNLSNNEKMPLTRNPGKGATKLTIEQLF
jgi:hypothetical protein